MGRPLIHRNAQPLYHVICIQVLSILKKTLTFNWLYLRSVYVFFFQYYFVADVLNEVSERGH